MSATLFNQMVKFGGGSLAALCLAWGGSASAGLGPLDDYTSVSRASVNINFFQQDGVESVSSGSIKTHDVINALTGGEPGSRPPNNLKLVLLSYCGSPEYEKALAVWDTDTDDLTGATLCLWTESQAIYDSSDKFYQGLDIDTGPLNLDEIDMDVKVTTGSVRSRLNSAEPVCLKSFTTLTMAGYHNGEGDSAVLKNNGKISTSGPVQGTLDGNAVLCD